MQGLVLYFATVMIWGSTWIAITFQLGTIDPGVSIAHRFMLASLLMFAFLLLRRQPLRLAWPHTKVMLLQAVCMFCVNYWFVYQAEGLVASGLVALMFSNLVIFNIFNGALFERTSIDKAVLGGALVGMLGMVMLFWSELTGVEMNKQALLGMGYATLATYLASLGNMAAAHNVRQQVPVLVTNAWGMGFGALCLYVFALVRGVPVTVDPSFNYMASLVFLAVFGSLAAFWCYITLIGRIGADRASYVNLLIPVVAMLISTVFEGYQWSAATVLGLGFILLGNYLVMKTARR